ncbi:MAG: hypothetical protein F6K19_02925 [Cyanothece sp. SIO1E1]|nr:hypothetical protein [Cyanothece sp. SIO1E1]
MASDTYFLQPMGSTANVNYAEATGSAQFFNYSQSASGSLTSVDFEILVKGGVAAAIANADATFINDPTFTDLFTENTAVGEDGAFKVKSKSKTEVVASFEVTAGQAFSFDFTADLDLEAREIEDPDAEYSKARSKTTFLVLDVSKGVENPKLLDFFGFKGRLISSEEIGKLKSGSSGNVSFTSFGETDIDGDNGIDFVNGFVTGSYQRTFNRDTQLAVVEINTSLVKLRGDTLIGNLGNDVRYGSIWADHLHGTNRDDKIYGSLGKDKLKGKKGDDILEGGHGKDKLYGNEGKDKLYGGEGSDTLRGGKDDDILVGGEGKDYLMGGRGSDTMTGGEGKDIFFLNWKDLKRGVYDVITDFEDGIDKIKIQGLGRISTSDLFSSLTNTQGGTLLTSNTEGQLFLAGVNANELSGADFLLS